MFDATLPDVEILQVYHPQVKVVANIDVAMPTHVYTKQVLHAPTSSNKLNDKKHLIEVRRYILQRWFETGCQKTLVVAQEKVEEYLKERGLPDNIKVNHYNNISGLDIYRDVRLQILVGGTAPGPQAMEALAAALSGAQPKLATPNPFGFTWYDQIKRGIRLSDERGVETNGDLHPDAFVESVRWLVHEGEQIQAIGRSRGIRRTADTPLDIDLLFNNCLPITVNEVTDWKTPSLAIEMVVEGAVLTSRVDMVKAWPSIWKNDMAAKRTLDQMKKEPVFGKLIADWRIITYQLVGPKMNLRVGYFDCGRISDPKVWLGQRLGPLKVYREGGPKFGEAEDDL